MKRTMKKHLALLLAALMLFSCAGINAFAVVDHVHVTAEGNPKYCRVVNPTCEEPGYTEYLCVVDGCGQVVRKGNLVDPLGHKLGTDLYEKVEGGYNKYQKCIREYTTNGVVDHDRDCEFRSYEMENGVKTLYHKVSFVNNKLTVAYDETVTYTKIVDTEKGFNSEELYSYYVKHGDEVEYNSKIVPTREKTKHYDVFDCIGWSTNGNLEAITEKNLTAEDCMDLKTITKELTTADLVLFPVFAGRKTEHSVIFYNAEGQNTTYTQLVNHGSTPKYSDPQGKLYPNPKKAEDLTNYYVFNGWSTEIGQTTGIPTEDIESTAVYADIFYRPAYQPLAKNFIIEFYDGEGNLLKVNNKEASYSNIHLNENFYQHKKDAYEEILNLALTKRTKDSDNEYYYVWAGWRVLRGDGTDGTKIVTMDKYGNYTFNGFDNIVAADIINSIDTEGKTVYLEDVVLPKGLTKDNKEPEKVIRLVPVFERRLQSYAVDVEMVLPSTEDADYFKGDAVVQIVDKNGQLAASGKTDANGKFRCRLNYRTPFTVTVATYDSKYLGTATISYLSHSSDVEDVEAQINKCNVTMKLNPEYETHCSCIHHNSLLQPIFVRILNILYTFFNVKYVCCYDMYSTIGPLLDYTK